MCPRLYKSKARRRDRLAAWWILWWPIVFTVLGVAGAVGLLLWVF